LEADPHTGFQGAAQDPPRVNSQFRQVRVVRGGHHHLLTSPAGPRRPHDRFLKVRGDEEVVSPSIEDEASVALHTEPLVDCIDIAKGTRMGATDSEIEIPPLREILPDAPVLAGCEFRGSNQGPGDCIDPLQDILWHSNPDPASWVCGMIDTRIRSRRVPAAFLEAHLAQHQATMVKGFGFKTGRQGETSAKVFPRLQALPPIPAADPPQEGVRASPSCWSCCSGSYTEGLRDGIHRICVEDQFQFAHDLRRNASDFPEIFRRHEDAPSALLDDDVETLGQTQDGLNPTL